MSLDMENHESGKTYVTPTADGNMSFSRFYWARPPAREYFSWEAWMAARALSRQRQRAADEALELLSAFAGRALSEFEAADLIDRVIDFADERGSFYPELAGGEHLGHLAHGHATHGNAMVCTCGEPTGVFTVVYEPGFRSEGPCPVCADWPSHAASVAAPPGTGVGTAADDGVLGERSDGRTPVLE